MNIAAQIKFIGKKAKPAETPNVLERARFSQVLETLKICRGFIREADDYNPAPKVPFERAFIQPTAEVKTAVEEMIPTAVVFPASLPTPAPPNPNTPHRKSPTQLRAESEREAAALLITTGAERDRITELPKI